MKIYKDIIQGTDDWFAIKLGKASASHFSDILAKGKGIVRRKYMLQLAAERMSGLRDEGYSNKYLERGLELEGEARDYYASLNNCEVQQVGFIELNNDVGCSPDGLVGENGLIEIKCPKRTTHIETILSNKMPSCYIPQVQGQLWVSGRTWCDFISFAPDISERPFFYKRVFRDREYIDNLKLEVDKFILELKNIIAKLTEKSF